jgi:hypothetical protein
VMKSTRSRLTLAKTMRSVKSSAQNGRTERPSTRLRSPPNIHWRPGELRTKGCRHTPDVSSTAAGPWEGVQRHLRVKARTTESDNTIGPQVLCLSSRKN